MTSIFRATGLVAAVAAHFPSSSQLCVVSRGRAMEPQHGSALMLATILVICFMLLSCLPEPPTRPTLVKRTTTKQIQELEAAADDPSSVLNNLEKKQRLLETLRTSCLPKLVCQLLASTDRKLSRSETSLLSLIK
ncbi:hypothetical protein B566_EDAN015829 [Ephemera danica]|nr:hypothetical protein B566_EDAN015829 [Ephemera danica]